MGLWIECVEGVSEEFALGSGLVTWVRLGSGLTELVADQMSANG